MPEVSVIIPFYNRENTLFEAINSVLKQSFTDFELILIDDGSSDNSLSVIKKFNDPRIKLIKHDGNMGAAAARNTGVKSAAGKYIALLDSDDIWLSNKLSKQIDFMKQNSATMCCTSFALIPRSKNKVIRRLDPKLDWKQEMLLSCRLSPGSTMIAKKEVFETGNVGLWNSNLLRFEDWDWLLRYTNKYKITILDVVLSEIRIGDYASFEKVKIAANGLWDLHKNQNINYCKNSKQIFKASIALEKSYSAFRNKNLMKAVFYLLKTFFISPRRFFIFLSRSLEKISE